jgi:hypothetical protein
MLIDAHVHFEGPELAARMLEDQARTGVQQFNILDMGWADSRGSTCTLAQALWFKSQQPDKVFVFGGLDFSGIYDHHRALPDMPFPRQLERLQAAGCDGLKLLIAKPTQRRDLAQPLDGPAFAPLFAWLEETRFPVLWHVGDPPEFWNPQAVPLWAKKHAWWYDQTYPPKSLIDAEVADVFARHPHLNLILAHFFFMSDDLPAAARFLDSHPGFYFDLAPGVEMLHNFTANRDAARAFFTRYASRIIFGTDVGMMRHTTGPQRGWMVRHFLETGDTFPVPDDPCMTPDDRPALHGLDLPQETLAPIFAGNFQRVLGSPRPRTLEKGVAREVLRDLSARYRSTSAPNDPAAQALADMA